jgi:hypothetical protein
LEDTNLPYKKLELIFPVFFGCLGSLLICALLALNHANENQKEIVHEIVYETAKEMSVVTEHRSFFARNRSERRDRIRELYREPETQKQVIDFFAEVCASNNIAEVILDNADSNNIAPALAFALAWEESRFNPLAVNNKNRDESIDRGLFQLNNLSFPRLETQAFFNPALNAKYGMSHLRYCLDAGGSEAAALAMYNAGTVRVRSTGTPKSTLDYISRILENRWEIEDRFREWEDQLQDQPDVSPEIAEAKTERPRLVPLMPLRRGY